MNFMMMMLCRVILNSILFESSTLRLALSVLRLKKVVNLEKAILSLGKLESLVIRIGEIASIMIHLCWKILEYGYPFLFHPCLNLITKSGPKVFT